MTLHEYTAQVGPNIAGIIPRGMPHYLPFSLADALVFSNEYEPERLARLAPWIRGRSHVFPIGSNIDIGIGATRRARVVYFGQICPNKGIEEFVRFCCLLRETTDAPEITLIGSVPRGFEGWAESVLRSAPQDLAVLKDLSAADVASQLVTSRYAYLPFPDGASAKRGSLLAALLNGVIVMTPHGPLTPAWMRQATIHAGDAEAAVLLVKEMEAAPERLASFVDVARIAAEKCDWHLVADLHARLYDRLVYNRGAP